MPRGIPKSKVAEMTKEELTALDSAPVPEEHKVYQDAVNTSYKKSAGVKAETETPSIKMVGNPFVQPAIGDAGTLRKFARTPADTSNWTPMTDEEAVEYGKKGVLIGYDPFQNKGLLKNRRV